jgi:hypothetical protein
MYQQMGPKTSVAWGELVQCGDDCSGGRANNMTQVKVPMLVSLPFFDLHSVGHGTIVLVFNKIRDTSVIHPGSELGRFTCFPKDL